MSAHHALLCRYRYDPLDRLSGHAAAQETDTQLFYQKSRLATQVQGASYRSILQAGDGLLAQQQGVGTDVATTLLATDQQRSVLHATLRDDHQAAVYTTYGYPSPDSGLASLLGFNGERHDPVTGHCLLGNGYRAFNAVLMRFNSPDNLSPFDRGGLNAYAYCSGDPVNHVDPDGHLAALFTGRGVFIAFGVTLGLGVATAAASMAVTDSRAKMILGVVAGVLIVAGGAGMLKSPTRRGLSNELDNSSPLTRVNNPPAYEKVMAESALYPAPGYEILPPYRPPWRRSADLVSSPLSAEFPVRSAGRPRSDSLPSRLRGSFGAIMGRRERDSRLSIRDIAFDLRR